MSFSPRQGLVIEEAAALCLALEQADFAGEKTSGTTMLNILRRRSEAR